MLASSVARACTKSCFCKEAWWPLDGPVSPVDVGQCVRRTNYTYHVWGVTASVAEDLRTHVTRGARVVDCRLSPIV